MSKALKNKVKLNNFVLVENATDIQSAIDDATNGTTLLFKPGVTYSLTKSTAYPSVYPVRASRNFGEQPCVILYQKQFITLDGQGATLDVGVHGLGALDILQCKHVKIRNFKIKGPGNFPQLDGTTGRGEKGTVSEGYYDAFALSNGPARNNSRNTSTLNTGGFGGAFPQFGGGTAATWGVWNGGYIGNVGTGIVIDDGSEDIIVEHCEIFGFNDNGIQVSNPLNASYGWAHSKRVHLLNNYIHDCYNAGIEYHNVKTLYVKHNTVENCGHPSASLSHTVIDPGYGIASNNGTAPDTVIITDNTFKGNKRKGIDTHSIDTLVVSNNVVSDSGYGINIVNGSLGSTRYVNVTGNIVKNIAYPVSAQATGIYVEKNVSGAAGFAGSVIISNNSVTNVGIPSGSTGLFPGTVPYGIGILTAGTLDGVVVSDNNVYNPDYIGFIGICNGFAGGDTIKGVVNNNNVRGKWGTGINNGASGNTNSATVGNNIEITATTPYTDPQFGIRGAADRFFDGNNVVVPTGQTLMSGNSLGITLQVKVVITAGSISYTTGFNQGRYVNSVTSIANGLQIDLNPGVNAQSVTFSQTSSTKAFRVTGAVPLDYIYVRNDIDPIQIGFQIAGTDYPASGITGSFVFHISI